MERGGEVTGAVSCHCQPAAPLPVSRRVNDMVASRKSKGGACAETECECVCGERERERGEEKRRRLSMCECWSVFVCVGERERVSVRVCVNCEVYVLRYM